MPYPPARPIVLHLHHFTKSLTLLLVIISFVAGQKTPFGTLMIIYVISPVSFLSPASVKNRLS